MKFTTEAKVGAFVLAGIVIFLVSILLLGDVSFQSQYRIYVQFRTAEGLAEKGSVKVSGVPVGKIDKIELYDEGARVTMLISRKTRLPKTATARINATGLIGSKYLEVLPNPNKLPYGEVQKAGYLEDGATIRGQDSIDVLATFEKLGKAVDHLTGDGNFFKDLKSTVANLKHTTDTLSAAIGDRRDALTNIVKNVEQLSARASNFMKTLDDLTSENKQTLDVTLKKLRETLENAAEMLARFNRGEGALGALMADKKVESDVKEAVTNIRQTTESAKEVLGRFTKVRSFWEAGLRYDIAAGSPKGDIGIRLMPRPGKYYVLGGSNLGSGTESDKDGDYERRNTINALLGRDLGPISVEAGAIRSAAGVALYWRPFNNDLQWRRFELLAKAFNFGRDEVIKLRRFRGPNYIAGAQYRVNNWASIGLQGEDLAQPTKSLNATLNASFEDKDFAYLLGFVSFAR